MQAHQATSMGRPSSAEERPALRTYAPPHVYACIEIEDIARAGAGQPMP